MPLFSVIIPCYNSSNLIKLPLLSIINQHLGNNIEVILVDDCSNEDDNLLDAINFFKDKLDIQIIKNIKNLGPGMCRQKGLEKTTGDWVVFCDHDDEFIPNTFNKIKTIIRNNPSRNIIQTRFNEISESGEIIPYSLERGMNWIHGKFFKRSFLQDYHLSFEESLATHEDIYFSILTRIATNHFNSPILQCDFFTYNWYNRPDSLSHKRETGIELFHNHFGDYVISAFGPIKKLKNILSKEEILSQGISSILFIYFYMEGFIQLGFDTKERDLELLTESIKNILEIANISKEDLIQIIYQNPGPFCQIRNKSFESVGFFFEKDNLEKIIQNLDGENINGE